MVTCRLGAFSRQGQASATSSPKRALDFGAWRIVSDGGREERRYFTFSKSTSTRTLLLQQKCYSRSSTKASLTLISLYSNILTALAFYLRDWLSIHHIYGHTSHDIFSTPLGLVPAYPRHRSRFLLVQHESFCRHLCSPESFGSRYFLPLPETERLSPEQRAEVYLL